MQIDERKIAVFIDFENVAMGVRESRYGNFDINLVLKRLVEKGKITVKRAYSDWHRYAEFKRAFHQANIELIDVPQSRYSGKNSADIRMVVDALDLSYQRDHIDTFVLVSGDSDFSPLVSKLREYGRYVIGMGVKQSSSDLLINNCDEFIFYEDLVRPSSENTTLAPKLDGLPRKKAEALRLAVETFEALLREGKEVIYGSAIKQTLVRKLPSFNEAYFGYPSFSRLLEDAAENKLLQLTKEQKSGGYIVSLSGDGTGAETREEEPKESTLSGGESPPAPARGNSSPARTRSSRSRRQGAREKAKSDPQAPVESPQTDTQSPTAPQALAETRVEEPEESALSGGESPPAPARESSAPTRSRSSRSRRQGAREKTKSDPQPPVESPPSGPQTGTTPKALPETPKAAAESPPPGETTSAETSADPQPPLEKKAARPRRRTSKSRSPGRKKTAAAKVAEDAPPTKVSAAPPAEVSAALPAEVPAAPPDQPAESASATATPPAGASPPAESPRPRESTSPARRRSSRSRWQGAREKAKSDPQPPVESPPSGPQTGTTPQAFPETREALAESPPPGETTPAEKSADPPSPLEKKAARPRRRTSKSRSPGRKKTAAAKVAEDAPPAEVSDAPPAEVPAAPPDQPAESASATAAPPAGASATAPPPAAPSPSDAAKPTSETGSGALGSRKSPGKASSARKGTTRSKTARRREAPVRKTDPAPGPKTQDSPD